MPEQRLGTEESEDNEMGSSSLFGSNAQRMSPSKFGQQHMNSPGK